MRCIWLRPNAFGLVDLEAECIWVSVDDQMHLVVKCIWYITYVCQVHTYKHKHTNTNTNQSRAFSQVGGRSSSMHPSFKCMGNRGKIVGLLVTKVALLRALRFTCVHKTNIETKLTSDFMHIGCDTVAG